MLLALYAILAFQTTATVHAGSSSVTFSLPTPFSTNALVWETWDGNQWAWTGPVTTDDWFAAWNAKLWPANYQLQYWTERDVATDRVIERIWYASTEPVFHCVDSGGAQMWLNHIELRDLSPDNPHPCIPDGQTAYRWRTVQQVARVMNPQP